MDLSQASTWLNLAAGFVTAICVFIVTLIVGIGKIKSAIADWQRTSSLERQGLAQKTQAQIAGVRAEVETVSAKTDDQNVRLDTIETKAEGTHNLINSRMDELLEAAKTSSFAAGQLSQSQEVDPSRVANSVQGNGTAK